MPGTFGFAIFSCQKDAVRPSDTRAPRQSLRFPSTRLRCEVRPPHSRDLDPQLRMRTRASALPASPVGRTGGPVFSFPGCGHSVPRGSVRVGRTFSLQVLGICPDQADHRGPGPFDPVRSPCANPCALRVKGQTPGAGEDRHSREDFALSLATSTRCGKGFLRARHSFRHKDTVPSVTGRSRPPGACVPAEDKDVKGN